LLVLALMLTTGMFPLAAEQGGAFPDSEPEVILEITEPGGGVSGSSLLVPRNANVGSATLKISTVGPPDLSPVPVRDPQLNVGLSGEPPVWRFDGTLGAVERFASGKTSSQVGLGEMSGKYADPRIRVPSLAQPTKFSLSLTGYARPTGRVLVDIDTVRDLDMGDDGTLWAASIGGLVEYGPYNYRTVHTVHSGRLVSGNLLSVSSGRYLYVGSQGRGMGILDPDTGELVDWVTAPRLPSGTITSLAAHGDGVLMGTPSGAAWYVHGSGIQSEFNTQSGMSTNMTTGVFADDDRFYLGTFGDGIYVYDRDDGTMDHWQEGVELPPGGGVVNDFARSESRLFIATPSGVIHWDSATGEFGTWQAEDMDGQGVTDIALDGNTLYAALGTSVYQVNLPEENGGDGPELEDVHEFPGRTITSLAVGDGRLAVGFDGHAVSLLNISTGLVLETATSNFWDTPTCMEGDGTNLYLGTSSGVRVYSESGGIFEILDISDGLASNDISALAATASQLFVGSVSGLDSVSTVNWSRQDQWRKGTGEYDLTNTQVSALAADTISGTVFVACKGIRGIAPRNSLDMLDISTGRVVSRLNSDSGHDLGTVEGVRVFDDRVYLSTSRYYGGDGPLPGGVWVFGTNGTFLDRWDTNTTQGGLATNDTYDVVVHRQVAYVLARDGIYRKDLDSGLWLEPIKSITTSPVDLTVRARDLWARGDELYIAATNGVGVIDIRNGNFTRALNESTGLASPDVRCLYYQQPYLYSLTPVSMDRYDPATGSLRDPAPADLDNLMPSGVYIDVGGDGSTEYYDASDLLGPLEITTLSDGLGKALAGLEVSHVDGYGNSFSDVALKVGGGGGGTLMLGGLDVRYHLEMTTVDMAPWVNRYLRTLDPYLDGDAEVPLSLWTKSPGSIALSDISVDFTLDNLPPRAVISSPAPGQVFGLDETIHLDGQNSTDPDGDIGELEFIWWDEITGEYWTGNRVQFPASILGVGYHRITLVVQDTEDMAEGWVDIQVVSTSNLPPKAIISRPLEESTFHMDEMIIFDGSESYDPDGENLSYLWEARLYGEVDTMVLGTEAVVETKLPEGEYFVTLQVSDRRGAVGKAMRLVNVVSTPIESVIYIFPNGVMVKAEFRYRDHQSMGTGRIVPQTDTGVYTTEDGYVDTGVTFSVESEGDPLWINISARWKGFLTDRKPGSVTFFRWDGQDWVAPPIHGVRDDDGESWVNGSGAGTFGLFTLPKDQSLPRVVSTDPGNGDRDVPVDLKMLVIEFSKPMDRSTAEDLSKFQITTTDGAVLEDWAALELSSDGTTLQIRLGNLIPGATYLVRISSDIRGEDGNRLDGNGNGEVDPGDEDAFQLGFTVDRRVVDEEREDMESTRTAVTGLLSAIAIFLAAVLVFFIMRDKKKRMELERPLGKDDRGTDSGKDEKDGEGWKEEQTRSPAKQARSVKRPKRVIRSTEPPESE